MFFAKYFEMYRKYVCCRKEKNHLEEENIKLQLQLDYEIYRNIDLQKELSSIKKKNSDSYIKAV